MNKLREVWKDIPEYEGIYQISNMGRIKSLARTAIHTNILGNKTLRKVNEIIKKPFINNKGYYIIELVSKKKKKYSVHRLVAESFIPNPENKPEVNHKNLNVKCNKFWNLEWSTKFENEKHAYDNGRKKFKGNQYIKL